MSEGGIWTDGMRIAWDYSRSAIERGLTATDGLRMFRDAGYKIGDAKWYSLSRSASEAKATGERVMGIPGDPPIPRAVYTVVDLDLPTEYNVEATVSYIDAETGLEKTATLHFGDNEEGSWADIESAIGEKLSSYGVLGGDGSFEIISARFYTPQWAQ